MKITRRQLRRLVEMAVRQDILDAVSTQTDQRTTLLSGPIDLSGLTGSPANQPDYGQGIKPVGLWYGFGTNWVDFVKDPINQMLGRYNEPEYFYKLNVATTSIQNYDQNKVLLLQTSEDLNEFQQRLGFQRIGGFLMGNWKKVSALFGGIEISDDLVSTFGWDIRSGCVWNKAAIIDVTPLQDPNVDQNIPRISGASTSGASASTGSSISFNPDAQTIEEIGSQKVIELLKQYEYEVLDYEGEIQNEAESAYGENIYEKILEGLNIDSKLWIKQAITKIKLNRPVDFRHFGLAEKISLVFWMIEHYDSSTGQLPYGTQSIIYDLPNSTGDFDFDAALDTFNSLLQSASDRIGLGISNIDLDYDDAWRYAVMDIESLY